MTASPSKPATVEREAILLETIPEIITKKIHYRGASIKPRDIFDIAAAAEQHADSVVEALRSYRDEVAIALRTIDKLNPDFVNSAISQLAIKEQFRPVAKVAFGSGQEASSSCVTPQCRSQRHQTLGSGATSARANSGLLTR